MRDLALDSLAAYRLTRLLRQDTISEPMRDAIEARSVEIEPAICVCGHADVRHVPWPRDLLRRRGMCEECACNAFTVKKRSQTLDVQPWAFMRDALDCPWCTSMWCAIFIVACRWVPGGRLLRNVLAVAALAGVAGYLDDHLTGVVHDVEHDEPVGTAQTES